MARIKLPSYIKEGHGRMEDAVIVTRKNTTYMMAYNYNPRGKTEKQKEIQNAFKTVVADWKCLDGIIKKVWDLYAKDTNGSGYNIFVGDNVPHRRAGELLELCKGMGEEILMNFEAVPGTSAGEIVCTFLPVEAGCHITFFTRKEVEPGIISPVSRHDAGADPASPFTISGLEAGANYHIYAIVTDAHYESASTVSQSVAASSKAG